MPRPRSNCPLPRWPAIAWGTLHLECSQFGVHQHRNRRETKRILKKTIIFRASNFLALFSATKWCVKASRNPHQHTSRELWLGVFPRRWPAIACGTLHLECPFWHELNKKRVRLWFCMVLPLHRVIQNEMNPKQPVMMRFCMFLPFLRDKVTHSSGPHGHKCFPRKI